jgi:hypothetical protein
VDSKERRHGKEWEREERKRKKKEKRKEKDWSGSGETKQQEIRKSAEGKKQKETGQGTTRTVVSLTKDLPTIILVQLQTLFFGRNVLKNFKQRILADSWNIGLSDSL